VVVSFTDNPRSPFRAEERGRQGLRKQRHTRSVSSWWRAA